jgi:UMF1 family MFS transporter
MMTRKSLAAWAAYDWANSAINTIIFTFVFSLYFQNAVYGDKIGGSVAWGYAQGIAGVFIALLSPIIGATIDRYGPHKPALKFLTVLSVALTASLFFIKPEHSYIFPALIICGLLTVAFEMIQNIYNATLTIIAPPDKLGRVSGIGWGFGYIGSIISLAIVLFAFIGLGSGTGVLGITKENSLNIRGTFVFTALWFAIFAIPFFGFCPDAEKTGNTIKQSLKSGLNDLKTTFKHAKQFPDILKFLAASAIYRDGLATLFAMGGLYAGGTLGMTMTEVMIFAIAINIASGIGAISFAFIDDKIGTRTTIITSLIALIIIGTAVVLTIDKTMFIILACLLGLCIGPVQSSSRTLLAQICPPDKTGTFFGLYAMSGRAVSFIGPFIFATLTQNFQSQRAGLASIIILWVIGLILFTFTRKQRP